MNDLFKVHRLNDEGFVKAIKIQEAFTELTRALEFGFPHRTRYTSLAVAKLEEAFFYAQTAMASEPLNHISPETEK